jgi:homoserine kinase
MGLSFLTEPARVRTPATSANLGPGFDALGLALALYDDVTARVSPAGCRVEVTGEGAGELPTGETHLVVRAMRAAFDAMGGQPAGLLVECVNRIPQARGLGSSSAAIVAGVQLARTLVDDGTERMDDAGALRLAAELEGHPDNVAPCLLGGFTIAWTEGPAQHTATAEPAASVVGGARAVSLAPSPAVRPTVYVPGRRGLTAAARAALPATVPHPDAARNAGRAALLVHAITVDPAALFPATEDSLHQPYRASGMPESARLLAELRGSGVAAVVSGAGPSVLALTSPPDGFEAGMDWVARRLAIDVTGARVHGGRLGHAERDPVAAGRKS